MQGIRRIARTTRKERLRSAALMLALLSAFFLGFAAYGAWMNYRFSSGPIAHLTATVEQTKRVHVRNNVFLVDYAYVWAGAPYFTHMQVLPITFSTMQQGERVPIVILENDPFASRLDFPAENESSRSAPAKAAVLSLVTAVIALLFAVFYRLRRPREVCSHQPVRG